MSLLFKTLGTENLVRFSYDYQFWNFKKEIEEYLNCQNLGKIHETYSSFKIITGDFKRKIYIGNNLFESEDTKKSLDLSEWMFNNLPGRTVEKLSDFIYQILPPLVGPILNLQKAPVIRFHFHGSGSVSMFHRDKERGQRSDMVNLWLPITNVWGNNSLWVEKAPETGNLVPLELEYGEAVIFRAADLLHGSVFNDTGYTRVSFDIRFTILEL
jgi:hypothetical protein